MSVTYALAEEFVSPQGEGDWMGTRMHFLRIAGCPVGKAPSGFKESSTSDSMLQVIQQAKEHPDHTICETAHSGQKFVCDTNYKIKYRWDIPKILATLKEGGCNRVCLTGGEPLAHPYIDLLVWTLLRDGYKIHIETSGTVPIVVMPNQIDQGGLSSAWRDRGGSQGSLWITCSPKAGYLSDNHHLVNEYKMVVTSDDEGPAIAEFFSKYLFGNNQHLSIWLQPLGDIATTLPDSMKATLAVQDYLSRKTSLHVRIGFQLHKLLGVR